MILFAGTTNNVGRHGVSQTLDTVATHVRRLVYLSSESVGDDLEQQADTSTARIS
jgi:hypothetical protein